MAGPFVSEIAVPVAPEFARTNAIREFVPVLGGYKFQMTAQSPDGLVFERRYLGPGAFIGGLLTIPIGFLIWAFVRRTDVLTINFAPSAVGTRMTVSGRAPRGVEDWFAGIKEAADQHAQAPAAG
jgi:hypothetical protein